MSPDPQVGGQGAVLPLDSKAPLTLPVDRFDRYYQRLIALAQLRLRERTKQKVEPQDVVHSMLVSLAARPDNVDLGDENSVWLHLAKATRRHCDKWNKRVEYNPDWEVPSQGAVGGPEAVIEPPSHEPSPADALTMVELLVDLLGRLNERECEILGLHLDDWAPARIAAKLEICERTVRRALRRAREILNETVA